MFDVRVLPWIVLGAACGGDAPSDGDAPDPGVPASVGPYFESPMFFNRDVSAEPIAGDSARLVAALRDAGGWGNGDRFVVDFSMSVLAADQTTVTRTFTPTGDHETPDCDEVPVPVPIRGHVEGEYSYRCDGGGDCHLIVHDAAAGKLYEMWRADVQSSLLFEGGCLAVWNTRQAYDHTLRGDQCTSADAAGFPIAPLLFTADEVAAGEIAHAIRFILPNDRIQQGFVRPATHGAYTDGSTRAPYYGLHLRLRADYPVDALPSPGARVVARALQRFGMYHADGGEYALTAHSDRYTTANWAGLLGADDLVALAVEDFEVIDHGPHHELTNDCMR